MKKLQQFKIYAFTYERIAGAGFKIETTPFEAELKEEVVSLGDNECLRAIRRITGHKFSEERVEGLLCEKKRIVRAANSAENKARMKEINNELREMLFVPEIVSVHTQNKKNYPKIGRDGFFINGKHYKRFMCGAGHARTNRSLFVDSTIYDELEKILRCGLDRDITIAPAKYNAYFALTSSATFRVTKPRVVVVPDCKIKMTKLVDWIQHDEEKDEDSIIREERELGFNLWDGMGIVCPEFANIWASDLELDYLPSAFIIRAPFCKGLVSVFDFHKFAKEIAQKKEIKDLWGNIYNIEDIDVILTESQFKLWDKYKSWEDYFEKLNDSQVGWGVSKFSPDPKLEKNVVMSNYQFLQVLDLKGNDIKELCNQTTSWLDGVRGNEYSNVLLYLLGKAAQKYSYYELFDKCNNPLVKALLLEPKLMQDSYLQDMIKRSIQKREKESCLGKLILNGNFQFMISDPYALCEHALGLEVKGLLNEFEHYSQYWGKKGITQIAAERAPLTWRSEVNILNLKNNEKIDEWFKYLTSGIVYNVWGVDCMIGADCDFDGDLVFTTDNKQLINNSYK